MHTRCVRARVSRTEEEHVTSGAVVQLSAAKGYSAAQNNLGQCYYEGRVRKDKKKALYYFKQAAGQGNAAAQYNCGGMYYRGDGVGRDVEEALRLWGLAAAQGNQNAQDVLARHQA